MRSIPIILYLLAISNMFLAIAWSLHTVISRRWIYLELPRDRALELVNFILSAEYIALFITFLVPLIETRLRRLFLIYMTFIQSIAFLVITFIDIYTAIIMTGIASAFGAILWVEILILALEISPAQRKGLGLGIATAGGTLGWGLGGVIPLITFLTPIHPRNLYPLVALTALISSYILFVAYRHIPRVKDLQNSTKPFSPSVLRELSWRITPILLCYTGIALGWNVASIKLQEDLALINIGIEALPIFSLLYTTIPSVIGAVARPLAGFISDRIDIVKGFIAIATIYTIYYPLLFTSRPPISFVLWLLPLYSFYDTFSILYLEKMFRDPVLSCSVIIASQGFTGLVALLVGLAMKSLWSQTALIIAILVLGILCTIKIKSLKS